MATVLVIDDDAALRSAIAVTIADLGHHAIPFGNGADALAWLDGNDADCVLLDVRMPGLDGLAVLRAIRQHEKPPAIAILTAVPTSENTIEAMRLGAFDHVVKPISRLELAGLLERMLPADAVPVATQPEMQHRDVFVGVSKAMREVQKAIGLLADSDTTVLLLGETGTGKEIVARAIHNHGRRKEKPFVAVNCAAIPTDLLESELFGHARGAFTNALADRAGVFRDADGGTLFLDEIGDMSLNLQAKMLRVLQERVVTPVGGRPVGVDVRVIAATHRDLPKAVRAGSFREDLYYRLGVVPILLPPLRERLADIVPLAEHFLSLAGSNGSPTELSADAASRLLVHAWPGNVRELRNAMERVAVLVRRPVAVASDLAFLGADLSSPEPTDWLSGSLPDAVTRLETEMIRRALKRTGGNRAQAAERLGIRRQLLYDKITRYGIEVSSDRTGSVRDGDESSHLGAKASAESQ